MDGAKVLDTMKGLVVGDRSIGRRGWCQRLHGMEMAGPVRHGVVGGGSSIRGGVLCHDGGSPRRHYDGDRPRRGSVPEEWRDRGR